MRKKVEALFAVAAPGVEGHCAEELVRLGMDNVRAVPGGVEWTGGLREIYLANLWLRTASRVLVRLGSFRCRDFPDLFRQGVRLPWGSYLRPGDPVQVRAASRRSRLIHTSRIAETIRESVSRTLGAPVPSAPDGALVVVRLDEDLCTVSVDSSGDLLHRRGYRRASGLAPLRETLAAAILRELGWDGREALFDPMCGSGTFLIEGALLAGNRPPGEKREFAFSHWPGFRPGLWQALRAASGRPPAGNSPLLEGADCEFRAIEAARDNAERAGVASGLRLRQCDFRQTEPPAATGLLVCNLPYGERVGEGGSLDELYRDFGAYCRRFPRWRKGLLCPETLAPRLGHGLTPLLRLSNGGIPVTLYALGSEI